MSKPRASRRLPALIIRPRVGGSRRQPLVRPTERELQRMTVPELNTYVEREFPDAAWLLRGGSFDEQLTAYDVRDAERAARFESVVERMIRTRE